MLQAKKEWRWFLSVGLVVGSIAGLELYSRGSVPARSHQLSSFPATIGPWSGRDLPIDERVQDVLKASDLLNRVYVDSAGANSIGLFVAYYDSQRRGGAIHSPKNCLPGAGWNIVQSEIAPDLACRPLRAGAGEPGHDSEWHEQATGPVLVPVAGPNRCQRIHRQDLPSLGCGDEESHGRGHRPGRRTRDRWQRGSGAETSQRLSRPSLP